MSDQINSAHVEGHIVKYCAVAVAVALVFIAIVVAAFWWHTHEVAFRVAVAKHQERCVADKRWQSMRVRDACCLTLLVQCCFGVSL